MNKNLLPKEAIEGKRGFYPIQNAQEWEDVPCVYKSMEWFPVEVYNDKQFHCRKEVAVPEYIIFDCRKFRRFCSAVSDGHSASCIPSVAWSFLTVSSMAQNGYRIHRLVRLESIHMASASASSAALMGSFLLTLRRLKMVSSGKDLFSVKADAITHL